MTTKAFKPMVKEQDPNVVKIAVKMDKKNPQLYQLNQTLPLATIIQDICNGWDLPDSDQYALVFSEDDNTSHHRGYITEKCRNEIRNGSILRLEFSATKTAQDILTKLQDVNCSVEDKSIELSKLSSLSKDITFAVEFIGKNGSGTIINLIEKNKLKGVLLAHCLVSFVELMDHGIISWDNLENQFISTVASYIKISSTSLEPEVIRASLSILESISIHSSNKFSIVEKEVPISHLVKHLQNPNVIIQQNTIALINAMFIKTDLSKKKQISATIYSKPVRDTILINVLQVPSVGTEMAHQLYVLQTLTLGLLKERMYTKMDIQDQDAHEKIKELRKVAFESDLFGGSDHSNRRQAGGYAKDYKKLGFKTDINPALDFTETPPGMLALDCMIYFARTHSELYIKLVLENSCRADEHECPFGKTSLELVTLLCKILKIEDHPSEQGFNYHPMLFTHDHPFEEFYCICIELLTKTWKDMRATNEDFSKVFRVVQEQITRALNTHPTSLEKFKQKTQVLTYTEITNLWQQERTSQEQWESHAKPIVELKELITPEIVDLIQQRRFAYLVNGTRFTRYPSKDKKFKNKFWYVRLSPNYKMFQYGDCDEKTTPLLEQLPLKLHVTNIKALIVGKDCPHIKENKKINPELAFSLTLDLPETNSLDFVAPDEDSFEYWTDGINALLGNKMTSKQSEKDLETLLSMEIKIRLLDAEGIEIPQHPPSVPEEPPNYDFNC